MGVELVHAITAMMLASFLHTAAGGNTTCAGNLTQWYTSAVGETACETYQSLRQICNPDYQVPSFRANTPGDNCDDQVADCCCNSVSWALSMLCMNCQWDVNSGSPNGIDAGQGAYGMYLGSCSAPVSQSLPAEVQTAVCNKGIKLANFLYSLYWSNGAWFYVYTEDDAQKDEAASNNNMYNSYCANTATSSTLSPSPSPTTSIAPQTPAGTPTPISSAGPTMSSSNISIQSPSTPSSGTATTKSASSPSKGTVTTTNASQMLNGTNAGSTGTIPPAPTNNASSVTNSSPTSSLKVIIGAVLGGLVGLCSLLAIFWWRRRNRGISKVNDNSIRQQTTSTSPYPITNADVAPIVPSSYGYAFARKQARAAADKSHSPVDRIRSLVTSAAPSQSDISDAQGSYAPLFQGADAHENTLRHEDAGIYPALSRVGSGRLPPAYDSNWRSSVVGNAGPLGERATSNGDFE